MPWEAPKSLTPNEVYASLAYLLNLADIVPADFILSEKSIREVQKRLPNRHGKVQYEGLWSIRGKGDVQNVACMKDCRVEIGLASALPDFARGTHGNLAEQQRIVGPARGLDTVKPSTAADSAIGLAAAGNAGGVAPESAAESMLVLSQKSNCAACHRVDKKLIGPSFQEIAAKYRADANAESALAEKVKKGSGGIWGSIPMPPNAIRDEDIRALVKWVLSGAPEK